MADQSSNVIGIFALILAILGIFFFTPVLAPVSALLALVALFQKKYGLAFAAFVCIVISIVTSPSMLALMHVYLWRLGLK